MEKEAPQKSGTIIRPKLLVPDKLIVDEKGPEKVIVVRGTIEPPKKT
jgi:hypothetical protein